MPFTLVNDCQVGKPFEQSVLIRSKYVYYTQVIFLAVLTLTIGKLIGLIPVPWKVVICFFFCGLFFFTFWYSSYGFIRYWNCLVMRNHEIIEQPVNLERTASLMVKEATSFIERNRKGPFLLFVSFLHVHTPLVTTEKFIGTSKHGLYGDNVEEMDWMVGKIIDAIEEGGLQNNTLTYFTSDHGGFLEMQDGNTQLGGWNGIFKGGKGMGGWEGGLRVPGIFRWPGVLPANIAIDVPTSLMDIYPTVVHVGGGMLPQDRIIDGRNLMPLLQGSVKHSEHTFMFHYCGPSLHAVRWYQAETGAIWKAHYVTPVFHPEGARACYGRRMCQCMGELVRHHTPPLLFDLSRDPKEDTPLTCDTEPQFEAVIQSISRAVEEHQRTLTTVPLQLHGSNNIWKPWLQPCCGTFPFCWCDKENVDSHTTV